MASVGSDWSKYMAENGWLNPDIMASLILDDGSVFKGKLFGAVKSVPGEVGKIFDRNFDQFRLNSEGESGMPLLLSRENGKTSCFE